MVWQNNTLQIKADLIANVPYTVTVYVPDGYTPVDMEMVSENVYQKTALSPTTQTCDIELKFQ